MNVREGIMKYSAAPRNPLSVALRNPRSLFGNEINRHENNKELINTYDEYSMTPLILAGDRNNEELIMKLLSNAEIDTIEHKNWFDGRTLLHSLARNGHTESLKCVLDKTIKHVNEVDRRGCTPLHYGMGSSNLSYEQHRQTVICLMTNGASKEVKDTFGKTPADLYISNKCNRYESSTKNEKKQELLKIIEGLSIPSQILARGEEAVKAFKNEIQKGEIAVVHCRLMLLGKEGAGKTSCVNSILGKRFNACEPSTDGIVRTTVFQTDGNESNTWEEQDIDVCELTKTIRDHSIAEKIAKKLRNKEYETEYLQLEEYKKASSNFSNNDNDFRLNMNTNVSTTKIADGSKTHENIEKAVHSTTHASAEHQIKGSSGSKLPKKDNIAEETVDARVSTEEPESQAVLINHTMQEDMFKKLVDSLCNKSSRPSDVTTIWDYAGQLKYYITHRLFLTDGSTYGVVLSVLDDLDDFVKPRDSMKGAFEMTYLEMTVFWIRSIYEHGILGHDGVPKCTLINGMIASPPICLIVTHIDQLQGTEEENLHSIKIIYQRIFDKIRDTPFEKHVDREMYAIDNTNPFDEGIGKLKKNVTMYMKSMVKVVPIKWVNFQTEVQEMGKTTIRMSLTEITKIAVTCGISESTVNHVLNYLNDVGVVLYSPGNKKLKKTVIINIHMIIEMFTRVITVVKPISINMWPTLIDQWNLLDDKGILHESLLRHLWKEELQDDENNFDVYVELMKLFGLIFEKESKENERLFMVPSRMSTTKESLEVQQDGKQTVSIYITPTDFLPDAIYNVLVVAFVDLLVSKGRLNNATLFRNLSEFDIDEEHLISLGTVKIRNKHALKLEISHRIEDEDGKHLLSEPHSSVCMEVLNYLKYQLENVYGTREGIGYKLRILCTLCQPTTEDPHLHDLDDCLQNDKIVCGKMSRKTSRWKRLFLTDLKPKFIEETQQFQVVQALILDIGTRKMKEYFLEKTKISATSISTFIKAENENGSFKNMKDFDGKDKMFSDDADLKSFDMTILMTLIRHCCGFTYPETLWDQPDNIGDSDIANFIRIQQCKNRLLDQNIRCRIPHKDFVKEWSNLKEIFLDLGFASNAIEDVRLRRGIDQTAFEEIQNFQAIMSLVVDIGTDAMRKNFLQLSKLKEKHVGQFLMNEKNSFKHANLTAEQTTKMFSTKADIKSFDITIMIKIIRHCSHCFSCWSNPDEMHILPNLILIHQHRNKLSHSASARMTSDEFETEWKKLSSLLQAVGVSANEIEKYKQIRLMA